MQSDILAKIRTFGSLGYSAERIADLLSVKGADRIELILRLTTPDDEYHEAYKHGVAIGEWNVDAELAKQAEKGDIDAIGVLASRSKERKIRDLKRDLFGI